MGLNGEIVGPEGNLIGPRDYFAPNEAKMGFDGNVLDADGRPLVVEDLAGSGATRVPVGSSIGE